MNSDYDCETRLYLDTVSRAIFDIDETRIDEIAALIATGAEEGRLLLVAGNGGSHLTALHLATDLEKCVNDALPLTQRGSSVTPRVRVLGENPGTWSAWANDDNWENALGYQVDAWGCPGDILLLLSASGASVNLLVAATAAHQRRVKIVALVGRKESRLEEMADVSLVIGTNDVQVAEDAHSVICHAIFREVLKRVKERCGVTE